MHQIKRQARRDAWYRNDDPDNKTYNPFARGRRRVQHDYDDESGLRRATPLFMHDSSFNDQPIETPPKASTFTTIGPHGVEVSSSSSEPDEKPRKRSLRAFFRFNRNQNDAGSEQSIEEASIRRRKRPKIPLVQQFKAPWTIYSLMFLFVPIGFVLNYTHQSPVVVFIINFLAIVPSNDIIGFLVEELMLYIGDTSGALLSMTFSNAAQLISSVFLLKSRQIAVLRSSLLGAILQSLLVMTGLAFLLGGYRRQEQYFNPRIAQTISMLLLLAVLSLTIPTVSQLWSHSTPAGVLAQSRGTAVIIIFSYLLWLIFQLKTNSSLFQEKSPGGPLRMSLKRARDEGEALRALALTGAASGAATAGGALNQTNLLHEPEEEEQEPSLGPIVALASLILFTTLLAFNLQFATDSVQGIMTEHKVSTTFMGIVVLPVLSNDPMTIDSAMKDKMDRSIALTLERCMQTALMIVPLIVLIAWRMNVDDMTLDFDGFSIAALFASIIIVTYVVQEGKSNWLTGALLLKVFLIIGLASFYIDD